jgi:hypothetical protein
VSPEIASGKGHCYATLWETFFWAKKQAACTDRAHIMGILCCSNDCLS